jgi:DNA-binding GntR family transcriptional regulator
VGDLTRVAIATLDESVARFWPRAWALVGELCLIRCEEYAELWIRGQLMREMTEILAALERDESQSAEQLLRLVYEELCRFAARHLAKDAPGQTLQPTALVQLGVSVSTAERLWA